MDPIYVTGHRNPDTDSIVAAIAYASLRNALGDREYQAACLGRVSDETQLVLNQFGYSSPTLISNVYTQIQDLEFDRPPILSAAVTLGRAWKALLERKEIPAIPVANEDGTLFGMMSREDIASYNMELNTSCALDKVPLFNVLSVLEGKVISSDRTGNVYRSLYIEDETAGLEVKIGKTGLYNDYKLGQTIYIKPKYLCLGAYGESVQLGAVSLEEKYETSYIDAQELINKTIIRGPYGEELSPHEITSGSMINESMVCRYVRLNNAVYQGGADGLRTWAVKQDASLGIEAAYGQQTFKVDGKEVVVRTSGYAAFADVEVGMETGDVCNITGILTKFYDTYQLVLLQVEDVERLD